MLSPFFDKRSFLALLFLTLAALAGNYFTLDLFFGISFLFGSIASLIVLYLFGVKWGILVAAISSFQTLFLWHHPYALIIFVLEVLFFALLRRQYHNILLLDMLYWLLIGMPLSWLFYTLFLNLDNTQSFLLMLKQAVNGIVNASIANLLVTYLPAKKWLGRPQTTNKISLQENILNLLICFLFLPLLIITLLDTNRVTNKLAGAIKSDLELTSNLISNELQTWHHTNLDKLNKLAQIAKQSNVALSDKLQVSTDLLQQLSPEFYSISIGDIKGNEIAFSGNTKNAGNTNIENNLLFEEAKKNLQPVISSANPNLKLPHRYVSLVLPVVINKQFAGCINSILDFSYFSG